MSVTLSDVDRNFDLEKSSPNNESKIKQYITNNIIVAFRTDNSQVIKCAQLYFHAKCVALGSDIVKMQYQNTNKQIDTHKYTFRNQQSLPSR